MYRNCDFCYIYLSDKYSEEQQGEVPGEEQEGGAEPQVIKEVQKSSYAVNSADGAGGGSRETCDTKHETGFMTLQ